MYKGKNIKGIARIERNLNKSLAKIEGKTLKGLIRAGTMVLYDVEKTSPLTPVDYGNLRASRFLVTSNGNVPMGSNPNFVKGKKYSLKKLRNTYPGVLSGAVSIAQRVRPSVVLGFGAYYAMPVHEMPPGTNWQRQGSGGKFFEKALDRNTKGMLAVIKKEVKI